MRPIHESIRKNAQYLQLYLVVAALLAAMWGGIAIDLRRAQGEVLSRTDSDLSNLALAFSKEIESAVKTIDLSLVDLREHWDGDPDRFAATVRRRQAYLENELAFQVAVIDAAGTLVFSNLEHPAKAVDLSDREHFQVHRRRNTDMLFISKPVFGRVSKRWSIQFTRPLHDAEERFAGVLVLSVPPEYFSRFYHSIRLPTDSVITLAHPDGVILARYPRTEESLGRSLSGGPFADLDASGSGSFQRISQMDGVERLYAWRRLEHPPLLVFVGRSMREITAAYRQHRARALLAGAGLSALLLLAASLKRGFMKQKARSAKRLADNEERWRLALEAAGDGVWDWNAKTGRVMFSPGWKRMLGYAAHEIGDDLDEWKKRVHPDDLTRTLQDVQDHFERRTPIYFNEHRMRCKDGSWKWILDRGMVMERDRDGAPLRVVGTHTDISVRKRLEEKLERLATTDALTGLRNRRCFLERLGQEVSHVRRYPQHSASVLMADLDFFKKINDSHGHAAGDAALRHFADLLREAVRESDCVGRLGGEEFAILLAETSAHNAQRFAQRLCATLRAAPLQLGGRAIPMTVSIGAAMISPDDDGPEPVLQRADEALYEAKELGRDRVRIKLTTSAPGSG